jgi:V8-like Glu-specific endopeptidase
LVTLKCQHALEKEIGHEPIGNKAADHETPPRGWITLPTAPYNFAANTPLFIVQHPDAAPMKLALDTEAIIGLNSNGTRVTYKTNTEPGSSGSPCFNQNWELVALHHAGDPKSLMPMWNRGIPIALVTAHLEQAGYGEYIQANH